MRLLLVGEAVALVLFTLMIPIEVIYAKESLGTTSAGFGFLLASWGAASSSAASSTCASRTARRGR